MGVTDAAYKVQLLYGNEVRHGPFQGMTLLEDWPMRNAPVLTLLGSYEAQLHPILRETIEGRARLLVNLGCADGYYAVGLARSIPRARVYAYDLSREARRSTCSLAEENGVADRLAVRGRLRRVPDDVDFLLCDIEGAEAQLFTPEVVSRLQRAVVVVEAHEGAVPGVVDLLRRRFTATHDDERVDETPRPLADYEELASLDDHTRGVLLSEFRPDRVDWMVFRPRSA